MNPEKLIDKLSVVLGRNPFGPLCALLTPYVDHPGSPVAFGIGRAS